MQLYRKAGGDGGWMSIMRTKRYMNSQQCKWNKIKIPIQRLCNGDYSRPILIKCFHDKDDKAPELIGQCETSLQALLDQNSLSITNPNKGNKVTGTLVFSDTDIIKRHGFLEYVMGGMNIEMMIGIDFTGNDIINSMHFHGHIRMYYMIYIQAQMAIQRNQGHCIISGHQNMSHLYVIYDFGYLCI